MSVLINSTKFSTISEYISTLSGEHNVQDIVDTILQISNLKSKTLDKLTASEDGTDVTYHHINTLYIDMTYQRRIRLRKLIKKLVDWDGFDDDLAGSIDIATRHSSGRSYIWDGARRAIMRGLCGKKTIRANRKVHASRLTNSQCQEKEAYLLEGRNTKLEGMKPEEIFKAQVVRKLDAALELKSLLEDCGLDVEGVIGKGVALGGFVELRDNFAKIDNEYFIQSSKIIKNTFKNDTVISVFLFVGLAYLLKLIDDNSDKIDTSYSEDEIQDLMVEYSNLSLGTDTKGNPIHPKQTDLCSPRLSGQTLDSVAFHITKNVLKDNDGLRDILLENLKESKGFEDVFVM